MPIATGKLEIDDRVLVRVTKENLFPFEDFPPNMIWVMGTVISESPAKRGGAVFRIALDDDRFKYVEQEGGNWKWPLI